MSIIEWTVVIGGLAAIAWVNWYFFLAQAMAEKQKRKTADHYPASKG